MLTYRHRRDTVRQAAAVVELAVCLPVIVLLIFASLEGANMLFLRQATTQAAYESIKTAVKSGGTKEKGLAIAEQILSARKIDQSTILFDPTDVNAALPGTPIQITIRVPASERSVTGIGPFRGITIESTATMVRE